LLLVVLVAVVCGYSSSSSESESSLLDSAPLALVNAPENFTIALPIAPRRPRTKRRDVYKTLGM